MFARDAATKVDLPHTLSRLLVVYLSAIGLLFVSVLGSVLLSELQATRIAQDAGHINVSGRQRMLSQRIIYLAVEHQRQAADGLAGPAAAELAIAIDDFEQAISLFETSHESLSTSPELSGKINALYFGGPAETTLDARVRAYIANARAVLADPNNNASLNRLKSIERDGLLGDLDAVVAAFEAESVSRVNTLRLYEVASLVIALLIILIEVIFVFLPGHRLLQRTTRQLEGQKAALALARDDQAAKAAELARQNAIVARDRADLTKALEESEVMRREQAEFTYAVSHDLKSPANTVALILGELELIEEERKNAEARMLIGQAQNAVTRMGRLIADVLQYSWATHHRAEPEMVDLAACVNGVLSDLKGEIRETGATVTIDVSGHFFAYRTQLRILIQNLVANALKFHAQGIPPEVHITCGTSGDALELCVRDNGIGIAPENQRRIFGLFKRLHIHDAYPGTGLGLSTCQRIAANHGGSIAVQSAADQGSTFSVTLQAPQSQSAPVISPPENRHTEKAA